jgi:hypothetical protein
VSVAVRVLVGRDVLVEASVGSVGALVFTATPGEVGVGGEIEANARTSLMTTPGSSTVIKTYLPGSGSKDTSTLPGSESVCAESSAAEL